MYCNLPSNNIPLTIIADVILFMGQRPDAPMKAIRDFVGKSEPYIRSGIAIVKMLGIIETNPGNGLDFVIDEARTLLGRTPSNELKLSVMRKYIQQYEPFVLFIQYCLNGDSKTDAARKVYTLYNFKGKDSEFLGNLFVLWGRESGIFTDEGRGGIRLTDAVGIDLVERNQIGINLDDDMAIRLYISQRLGADVFSYMDSAEVEELVNAFKKCISDPRGAMECAGRAFEDFLRRIAQRVGVDVTGKTGIGQVVNALYNNRDATTGTISSKIHSKQYAIGNAIGDIRNMAGHSREARTMERWGLDSKSSQTYVELVLCTIRSIYKFVVETVCFF